MAIIFKNSFTPNTAEIPIKEGTSGPNGEFQVIEYPYKTASQSRYFSYPNAGYVRLLVAETDLRDDSYQDGRRVEVITTGGFEVSYGTERWFYFVYRFPTSFPTMSTPIILFQNHANNAESPPITINCSNGNLGYKIAHSTALNSGLVTKKSGSLGAIPKGRDVPIVMCIKQSQSTDTSGNNGRVRIWFDGAPESTPTIDYRGPCGYNDTGFGYPKYGFYPYAGLPVGMTITMEMGVIREGTSSSYAEVTGGSTQPTTSTISLTAPNDGDVFAPGQSFTITTSYTLASGRSISKVEFYDDGLLIERTGNPDLTGPTYSLGPISFQQVRTHELTCKMYLDNGTVVNSSNNRIITVR